VLPWEEVAHTADWALKVRGEDLRALFENAARGMLSLIEGQAAPDAAPLRREFDLSAPDLEMLLVDWLTGLLALVEDEGALISEIDVERVAGLSIKAGVSARYGGAFTRHIKAVTFHNLSIRQTADGYETVIVFDV
jgi:SHS2 domain-containing protein